MQGTPTAGSVGAKLTEARKEANLSWEALAAAAGISLDTLKRYERGETESGPSFLTIVTVARLTGKPVDWFMTIDPEPVEAVA